MSRLLLHLLTAGIVQVFSRRDDETLRALGSTAAEKRQGTKSREVGAEAVQRYGDLMLVPTLLVEATRSRGELDICTASSETLNLRFGGRLGCIDGRSMH